MNIEKGKSLDLHLQDGRTAQPIAVAGDADGLGNLLNAMASMADLMVRAGPDAGVVVGHFSKEGTLVINQCKEEKPKNAV